MKVIEILENPDIFYFDNWKKFKPRKQNPFISLAKKETVESVGRVKFSLLHFIRLLDDNWKLPDKIEIKLYKTNEIIQDARLMISQVLVWERRSINSNPKGRGKIPCILGFNYIKKDVHEVMI